MPDSGPAFLAGGGEMGERMRRHDWSRSPLGAPDGWPQSLRTVVSLMLNSRYPMFVAWGPELGFLYNDGYRPILGTKQPHALGLPFQAVWSEIWADIEPLVRRALAGEASFHEDMHLVMERNGYPEDTWYTFSYSPVRDESGGVGGMFCACTETTGKVLHDRRLSEEREQLRSLFRQAPGFMAVLRGPDLAFELANAAYMRLIGGHRDIIGVPVRAALPEVQGQGFFELLEGVYQSGQAFAGRKLRLLIQRVPDGPREEAFVDFVYQPILDGAGQVSGIFIEGSDVTERVRAEEALRRLTESLEEQVEARTRELRSTEEALRQAQKMEAVGQLTGGIAHDFNNLLTGITGALALLQRRLAEGRVGELQRYADIAVAASNRAAALTQRLLAFARRQPLDPRPVDVNQLVASMEELLRRTLGPAIALELRPQDGLWTARCDPHQLESALLNLAINARDAMPEGGSLTIATANAELDARFPETPGEALQPGRYVALRAIDTGTGMSPEVQARVFEPFFTTKPIGQGTGLGLSMLYGFVRQSGGQVRLDSAPGVGTTVCLYLPCHDGTAEEARDAARAGMPASLEAAGPPAARETLLLVEDEPALRSIVTEALRDLGYRVIVAPDGPAALRLLQPRAPVDLLLTDVGLPGGMNGRQLAEAARERIPGLRVLFITGYAHNAAPSGGTLLLPGMEMMPKPFALDELAARIRAILGPA